MILPLPYKSNLSCKNFELLKFFHSPKKMRLKALLQIKLLAEFNVKDYIFDTSIVQGQRYSREYEIMNSN